MENLEIAVIGMDGIFPSTDGITAFWDTLYNGKERITSLDEQTLIKNGFSVETISSADYVKARGLLPYDIFMDYSLLNEQDQKLMDPQLRILLYLTQRLSQGKNLTKKSTGIFLGVSSSFKWRNFLYREYEPNTNIANQIAYLADESYYATQISYRFGFTGPSITILCTCSSSLTSVHMACQSLIMGECETALAGGASIAYPFYSGYEYVEGLPFSPNGQTRPFDQNANGTVPGDGAGIVVLKMLDKALEDNDNILAIIRGTAINNDGDRKLGYRFPSVQGQIEVIQMALSVAEIEPKNVSFVEAHGTGTLLGDAIELEALSKVYSKNRTNPCIIGSVKGNIGHLDAACGIAGLIKSVSSLQNKCFPASLNYEKHNPQVSLDSDYFYVNTKATKLFDSPLICGVNCFGDGGSNAHVILQGV